MLVPPEEKMIHINVKPASDLPYPARVSGDITSEYNPEWESPLDFTFPVKNLSESRGEILAESFMSISSACASVKTLYPTVLPFDLNEYLLACCRVFYRQVRLKAMSVCYIRIVNLLLLFYGNWPIFINPGKFFRFVGYPVSSICK